MKHALVGGLGLVAALSTTAVVGSVAHAQDVDIEVPVLIFEEAGEGQGEDTALDLANIVQSAAKGVTTVQEAPAIVTVITADEIRERGMTTLEDALDVVPGYMKLGAVHNQFPFPLTRGTLQATMFLVNGVSMFDPMINVLTIYRVQPIETVKRIELVSGPGGVLWGANSYLGIMNVITKDADDVDGVEADVGIGTGNGDREYLRGYMMAGIPELFSDDSKLFIHSSFETYVGPGYQMPLHLFSQPLPNPNANTLYGPLVRGDPPRSFLFNLDGKLSIGALNIYFNAPLVERHTPLGFPGFVTRQTLEEDSFEDCIRDDPSQFNNPEDRCLDIDKRSRDNRPEFYDRYVIAEYRTRLAEGKAGITVKGYFTQFVRDFKQLGILSPLPSLLEGGLAFKANITNYRAGGLIDGDLELPGNARLLYGAEAFHEWFPDNTSLSRQGEGIEARFIGPYQLDRLPLLCPQQRQRDMNGDLTGATEITPECPLTFAFTASRTVLGAYVNPQWRVTKKLTLDAGARLQVSPTALGRLGYDLEPLFSAAFVYNFLPDWHFKANYAEGFRPPVFNNTNSNGEGVQLDGSPDIEVERSTAGQAEVNARLYKGERRIRELNFRADYSYTKLENLIQIVQGRYQNTADRGIHSAEFLGKLYVQGGHRVELSYTWLVINTADKGRFRAMPEHWFNLSGVFALSDSFTTSTNFRVLGAHEDANRIVEYRNLTLNENGLVENTMTGVEGALVVQPHEMVLDRLPPSADVTVGLQYTGINRLRLGAFVYNAFNNRYYQPDAFFDYEPRLEFLPNPAADFRFQVHATYTY